MVVDKCPGCGSNDLDISPTAFSHLASQDLGRIKVDWEFLWHLPPPLHLEKKVITCIDPRVLVDRQPMFLYIYIAFWSFSSYTLTLSRTYTYVQALSIKIALVPWARKPKAKHEYWHNQSMSDYGTRTANNPPFPDHVRHTQRFLIAVIEWVFLSFDVSNNTYPNMSLTEDFSYSPVWYSSHHT
jgi:hypothetical protein